MAEPDPTAPFPPTPLRLARSRAAARGAVDAWFLHGDDLARHLREIAAWQAAGPVVVHRVVRATAPGLGSGSGSAAACLEGIVVRARGVDPARVSPHAQALARVGRLLIPADARLEPAVGVDELDRLLPAGLHLFLPAIGAVALGDEDGDPLAALVRRPRRAPDGWRTAERDARPAARLVDVRPIDPPPANLGFDPTKLGIGDDPAAGTSPRSLRGLSIALLLGRGTGGAGRGSGNAPGRGGRPESGGRPGSGEGDALPPRFAVPLPEWLAGWILRWTARVPGGAAAPTWVDRLERWARSRSGEGLRGRRNAVLRDLLEQLERDPDAGLHRAIPVGPRPSVGRGKGRDDADLGRRVPEFSLADLGGGRRVSAWDVDPALRAALTAKYRELALRERRLGRFRRAAFIHAHLLGDLRAAAAVLRAGRHHREAAILYAEHLNDRAGAAETLQEGGLLVEALEAWRDLKRWDEVAALAERLGRDEEARDAHERRLVARREQKALVEAAKIAEGPLRDVPRALELLASGWPNHPLAEECRLERLRTLRRHGLRDALGAEVDGVAGEDPRYARPLLQALARFRGELDGELVVRVDDAARTLAGRAIQSDRGAGGAALRALRSVLRGDRLAQADVARVLERIDPPGASPGVAPLRERASLRLPRRMRVEHIVADSQELAFVGRHADGRPMIQAWSAHRIGGGGERSTWPEPPEATVIARRMDEGAASWAFRPDPSQRFLAVGFVGPEGRVPITPIRGASTSAVSAGTPSGFPDDLVAIGGLPGGGALAVIPDPDSPSGLAVVRHDPRGEPIDHHPLRPDVATPAGAAVTVAVATESFLGLVVDHELQRLSGGEGVTIPTPSLRVHAASPSPPMIRERVLLTGEGSPVLLGGPDWVPSPRRLFPAELNGAVGAFLGNGAIVFGAGRLVVAYRSNGDEVREVGRTLLPDGEVVRRIGPACRRDEAAVVTSAGRAVVYRVAGA